MADNCHYDRRTLETIRGAGFKEVDGEYFELENCGFLPRGLSCLGPETAEEPHCGGNCDRLRWRL